MTILTGLQPTGDLHIGNYFGAILPMVQKSKSLSEKDKMYFFVPDLHALTIDIDYTKFYQNIIDNIRIYIASGINTKADNITLYRQSQIPAHSEMQWLLSCFSYFGEMSRMTQFKDKSGEHEKNVNVGLFAYPILMAGDILLYNAEYIPVGEDQQQHLELVRNLAIRINNKFADRYPEGIFTIPRVRQEQLDFVGVSKALRIRSLSNPEKKMSKSSQDEKSKIMLTDQPTIAAKKVMSATTDSLARVDWDWDSQPGITNLLQIYSLLTSKSEEQTRLEWVGHSQYGTLKKAVAAEVEKFLTYFQSRLGQINDQQVEDLLIQGEKKANLVANHTLSKFQCALGLRK